MGILNITPDSFHAPSRVSSANELVDRAGKMIADGASILDIGAQSTRPGATLLSAAEESDRLEAVLNSVCKAFPEAVISIDTFYASVARMAVNSGAAIINDISGGDLDPHMFATVAELNVPYILMHTRGTPQTMHNYCNYDHVVLDVVRELSEKIAQLQLLGVNDIIVDPGFGFAKTLEQNFELMGGLRQFELLNKLILVGISRKGMIWKALNSSPEQALNGTTALNMAALMNGASMLRVHDVKEAVETVELFTRLQSAKI